MKTYVEFKPDPEKGGEPIPGALVAPIASTSSLRESVEWAKRLVSP
jgi:hypothetical protein